MLESTTEVVMNLRISVMAWTPPGWFAASFHGRESWVAPRNQEEAEMNDMTVAVDLAKDVFEVALANRGGRIFERKRLTRSQCERFIDALTPGTHVVMEACGTAHYWGRRCRARELEVRLLPGQYVRPYVAPQQNRPHGYGSVARSESVQRRGSGAGEGGGATDPANVASGPDAMAGGANRAH